MGAGTLVHSFGSMYLSPMIPIYLRNDKGNGGKFLREVGKDEMLKWMVYEEVAIVAKYQNSKIAK